MTRKSVAVWAGAAAILGAAALALLIHDPAQRAHALAPARIILTDPDEDDVVETQIKTRNNGDGTLRAKVEFDIQDVTEGLEYIIRIEVIEVGGAPIAPLVTPPLRALPPRG